MKKIFTLVLMSAAIASVSAQGIFDRIKKDIKKDSSKFSLPSIRPASAKGLSNDDIVSGLKEALRVSTDSTTKKLSASDGFFRNAAIKVLMPPEAVKVEKTLRSIGAGSLADKLILSMNRAAEDAASGVGEIFLASIKQMTITDALGILRGSNTAATDYLKRTTTASLTEKMRPVIEASLQKVNATQYWQQAFSKYNLVAKDKVNTDLTAHVTGKAMDGLFYNIALEEQQIRKDPAARVTDILKTVFK